MCRSRVKFLSLRILCRSQANYAKTNEDIERTTFQTDLSFCVSTLRPLKSLALNFMAYSVIGLDELPSYGLSSREIPYT